jgi:hypothetical protein
MIDTIKSLLQGRNYRKGDLDDNDRSILLETSKHKYGGIFLNIGTRLGESAIIFSIYGGLVYTVDVHEDLHLIDSHVSKKHYKKLYKDEFDYASTLEFFKDYENVRVKKGLSYEVAYSFFTYEMVDYVFIDGDHTYSGLEKDFSAVYQIVKPGGYIAFHDYTSMIWKDVGKFVDEKVLPIKDGKVVQAKGSVIVWKKPS